MSDLVKNGFQMPLLHSNGSGAENLGTAYADAIHKLHKLTAALGQTYHMRDYYPLDQQAVRRARSEHDDDMAALEQIENRLQTIYEHIVENQR